MHSKSILLPALALVLLPTVLFFSLYILQTSFATPSSSPIATPTPSLSIKDLEPNVFSTIDYGPNCAIQNTCNNLVELNCQSPTTAGPIYYIDIIEDKALQTCGSACTTDDNKLGICQECPPSEWQTCLRNNKK